MIKTFLILFVLQKSLFTPICHLQNNQNLQKSGQNIIKGGSILLAVKTSLDIQWGYRVISKKQTSNFQAKYKYGNQEQKKGITNFHLNIRSLRNKVCEVKTIIKEHKPHIIGISECELQKANYQCEERNLKIPGYDLAFPKSWSVHGYARVVVYIKSSLHYEQVHDLEDDTVQSIWIKGGFKNSKKLYFCHAYREHTSTLGSSLASQRQYLENFFYQWEAAAVHSNNHEPNEIHVSGDMNLDSLGGKWLLPTYHLVTLSRLVQAACNVGYFTQLVSGPTRFQYNSVSGITDMSCIDHIYTNAKFRCSNVVITSFGGSDHDLIGYTRFSKDPPSPARTIRKRSYKKFVADDFLSELRKVDWGDVYQCVDLDIAADTFTRKFRDVLNRHAPWIIYQQRKKYAPWVTEETLKLMKTRDASKQQAVNLAQSGEDASEAWSTFRMLRNQVNNRRKYEERNFKADKIKKSLHSPSDTWNTAKSFMNWESNAGPPHQLSVGGRLVTKASEIASEMNSFFINKVRLIRESIRYIPNPFTACYGIMRNRRCNLSMKHVTVLKVNKLLKKLKNSKSCSIDELDNFCVKLAADVIDKPLHHIITLSIQQKKFPSGWKLSKVIPLHKKNCKMDRQNFRPVAILSPLSKILEKIVYEQIYEYFSKNKIFHPSMHGYRQHRSTQTAMLSMYDRWVTAAAGGHVSGVVLLDLSAAFDLVEPNLLIQKLRIYGLDEDYLSWVESYLTDRYQAVWIDHVLSQFLHCPVGVPQGSNLGPLFFLIFFNDLPYNLECDVDNYADDTTLTATGKSVEEIGNKLTEDCLVVSQWMRSNMLKLNPGKTHILTVGTSQRLRTLPETVQVVMDDVVLQEDPSHCELLLGCQVESDLKWHSQVECLLSKLRTRLTGLANLRFIVPFPVRKTITEGIFNSVLVYCLPLYGGSDRRDVKDIQILQNKAAQIVCHAPPRANRNQLFNTLGWMTVNQLITYHTLITVFKIRNSKEPEYLASILTTDSRTGRIFLPNFELGLAQKSFTYRGAGQWNSLPESLRKITKISLFKKNLKVWIIENIPRFLD